MVDLDAKYKERKARKRSRRRVYANFFLFPLIAVWLIPGIMQDPPLSWYVFPVTAIAASVSCYLQAKYLRMPSARQWAVAGFFFNLAAMIYLLGYAHGKGFPKVDV